jgi:hypothetical protein
LKTYNNRLYVWIQIPCRSWASALIISPMWSPFLMNPAVEELVLELEGEELEGIEEGMGDGEGRQEKEKKLEREISTHSVLACVLVSPMSILCTPGSFVLFHLQKIK